MLPGSFLPRFFLGKSLGTRLFNNIVYSKELVMWSVLRLVYRKGLVVWSVLRLVYRKGLVVWSMLSQ